MPDQLRIVVGSDDAGFDYKEILKRDLEQHAGVASVVDVGVDAEGHTAYPKVAIAAAELVASGEADRALLVCGTGLGVAIAANKVPGVRAALCTDAYTAEGARRWNDANVLALSLRLTSEPLLEEILDAWFTAVPSQDEVDRQNIQRVSR